MAEEIEYGTTGKPHPYHLVRPSIWPLVGAFSAGLLAIGAIMYMHGVEFAGQSIGLKGVIIGLFADHLVQLMSLKMNFLYMIK